jgi:hypothetical protein
MRRYTIVGLFAVALAAALLAVPGLRGSKAEAVGPADYGAQEVGVAPTGWNALEFVGRIDQDGGYLTSYGYLTYVRGLSSSAVFTEPFTTTETTARFTYYATSTLTARAVISNVTELNVAGETTFYFHPYGAQADFGNPASFTSGTPVGSATGRLQNILNVQAPNLGVSTGFGELVRQTAGVFTLGAQSYQFGRVGLMEREFFTGEGTRTDPIVPRSFIVGGGNTLVVGQQGPYMPLIVNQSP